MALPDRSTLLAELDGLGYAARRRRVALLARDAEAREAEELTRTLARGGDFEQDLALQIAAVRRDDSLVLAALTWPSARLRIVAAGLAPAIVREPEPLVAAVAAAVPAVRRRLLKAIVRRGRRDVAEALVAGGGLRSPAEAALLLPALDAVTVAARLPEQAHAVRAWAGLVRRHPDAALAWAGEAFTSASRRERAGLWRRLRRPLARLGRLRPRGLLELALQAAPPRAIPAVVEGHLGRATGACPELVFALLARPAYRPELVSHGLPDGVRRHVRRLSREHVVRLARLLLEAPIHLAGLLSGLPPADRGEVFDAAVAGVETAGLCWPDALLEALPHAVREREARRMLGLRTVREDLDLTATVTAHRDLDAVRGELEAACRAGRVEDRQQAYALLVRATRVNRRGLGETLAFLARIENEQDPVRLAAVASLARVPASLFAAEHAAALSELVDAAARARDTSAATRHHLQELALGLLRAEADRTSGPLFQAALEALRRLARQTGHLFLHDLERRLPPGGAAALVGALRPLIEAASRRERHELTLGLAEALGRRGWDVAPLQELVGQVLDAKPDYLAQRALRLWLAPPRTRDERVRALLDDDPSAIVLDVVFQHLHRRRTEWLDPYLEGRPLHGRFFTGRTVFVLPARDGFHRWLPPQQEAFAGLLGRIVRDPGHDDWSRRSALEALARIPQTGVDGLVEYLAERQVTLVQAVLGGLARTDRPQQALAHLLDHVDSSHVHAALEVLARCARWVEPDRLAGAVRRFLARPHLKVTVRKELLRILGGLRPPGAVDVLADELAKPDVHPDVRIAAAHAARRLLDRSGAWTLVEGLAAGADADLARSLLRQRPADLPRTARSRYAALVVGAADHTDRRVRREAFVALAAWAPDDPGAIAAAAGARVADLDSGPEWRAAARTLLAAWREGAGGDVLVRTASALAAAPAGADHDATRERDLPGRQRLTHLVELLEALPGEDRVALGPDLDAVAAVAAAADPTLWPLAARLRAAAIDWRVSGEAGPRLAALAGEAAEEPLARTAAAASAVAATLSRRETEWAPADLLELAGVIAGRPDAAAGLLTLALVAEAGHRLRWDVGARERLRALRRHPAAVVRIAARDLWTSGE